MLSAMGAATITPKGKMDMVGVFGTSFRMVIPAHQPAGVSELCRVVACYQEGRQGGLPLFHSAHNLPRTHLVTQHEVDDFPPNS